MWIDAVCGLFPGNLYSQAGKHTKGKRTAVLNGLATFYTMSNSFGGFRGRDRRCHARRVSVKYVEYLGMTKMWLKLEARRWLLAVY
jgi:hypothetical protein